MSIATPQQRKKRPPPRGEASSRGASKPFGLRRQRIIIGLLVLLGALGAVSALRNRQSDAELAGDSYRRTTSAPGVAVARLDWPKWRGLNGDGVSPETNLLTNWPEQGPDVLWRKVTSGPGYSGLSIAAGRLYTMMQDGDHEAVDCCDAATGDELWRFRYPASFVNDQGSGPRSTPTVDGDRVYTVGATGIMFCLNAATGKSIWRCDLVGELGGRIPDWGVSFSPLVDSDLVFTQPGGAADNSLAAFDKRTGKMRWQALDDRPGYASPLLTTAAGVRQVLFFTAEALVSVAPHNGRLYWRLPWSTMMDCNVATPICEGDFVFISSGYDRGCALLKVVPKGAGALDVEVVYEHDRMRNHFSTSVLYEGHLYGFDETRLVCMELSTGSVLWQAKGFRKGSVVVADGHLIILGENGKLAVAEATPAAYREKASIRVSRNRCWTVPTLAGGKLYVRDQEQIICLDLRKLESSLQAVAQDTLKRELQHDQRKNEP